MKNITAMILTFNEKENIGRTLKALAWVDEVLIIDSYSTDDTVEIARSIRPDLRLEQRPFDSFAQQCNFGLSQIQTEWVLSLDADYVLTPDLSSEILSLEPLPDVKGYRAGFRYLVGGQALRTTIYPPRVAVYRSDSAGYRNEGHGHRVYVEGPIRSLAGRIDHDDRKPLSRWISAQDNYTRVEARHLAATPNDKLTSQDRLRKKVFYAPLAMFFFLLVGRGLILDGWRGWYYVAQRTIAELLLSLRLLTQREKLEPGEKNSE